jgi:hypothetical protein
MVEEDGAGAPYTRDVSGSRPRRRLVVAGMVTAAVLAGGALITGLLVDGDDPSGAGSGSGSPAASTAPSNRAPGVASFTPTTCAGPAPANLPRTPQPGALRTGPRNGYSLVAGMSYYRDPSGFLVAVPDGWTYETVGTTLCFRDPAGIRVLSVDAARKPSADPIKACRDEAARLTGAGGLPGYEEIGIRRVQFVTRAADWEYRYDDPEGTRLHANTRWIASGGKGYAIGWVTSEFDWNTSRYYLDMIQASFQTG